MPVSVHKGIPRSCQVDQEVPWRWNHTGAPTSRGAQQEGLRKRRPPDSPLREVELHVDSHPDAPTPTADLAYLTNTAVNPKTLQLLPHVKTDLTLQAISTASVRQGKTTKRTGA